MSREEECAGGGVVSVLGCRDGERKGEAVKGFGTGCLWGREGFGELE